MEKTLYNFYYMKKDTGNGFESLAMGFFFGNVDEDTVFPFPSFTEEQGTMAQELVQAIDRFAETSVHSDAFDREEQFPAEYLESMKELGLYGLVVEESYGGMELDASLNARVFQQISGFDGATAVFLGGHQSIGYKPLLNEGTDEQKAKWLPDLASGRRLAAFCLTEPGSGSDAYSIKTKAVDNGDGTFTITGQKLWITNGGLADFYSVFCKTDHENDGKTTEKISCFVVEKDAPGSQGHLTFGEKEKKMGIRASETRAVYFDKVVVPKENLIGEPGKGFKIAMNVLNAGRLSLGSGTIGGMKSIVELATKHAKNRSQFNRPICQFGLIQQKISYMACLTYAAESTVYLTTGLIDRGMKEYYLESAICKVFCSEALWKVVDSGLQIAAGNGYMCEYPYERILRDSRINLIFEGTNEILRVFLALSGIKGPAESMRELGKIADVSNFLKAPIKSLGLMGDFAKGRIKNIMGIRHLSAHHKTLDDEASFFSSMLGQFAIQIENVLIKHGKNIIGNEYPQERISNMAIDLYVILAMISRTSHILNDDANKSEHGYAVHLFRQAFSILRYDFIKNLKGMNKNIDSQTKQLSEMVCQRDGYGLDIIHF